MACVGGAGLVIRVKVAELGHARVGPRRGAIGAERPAGGAQGRRRANNETC